MTMRWGIAGTGRIASDFARDLANIADAQLVAVGSRSIDSARTFASSRNIPHVHGSVADLARDTEVDVVYVAGIHPVHREQAILMMESGKHVLVEKPLAMNPTEVDDMLAVSASSGRFLMEAMWMRFNPLHVELKRRLDTGEFGKVISIESDFSFAAERTPTHRLFDPTKGGGSVLDVGIYPITLAWWFIGEPTSWNATGVIGPTGVDERATIEMQWSDGRSAHLTCGSTHEGSTASTIVCESATIVIPTRSHASNIAEIRTSSGTEQLVCDEPGLHHQVREVHRCIAAGENQSPRMSHRDSRAISAYMDSVLNVLHHR